jgi:hypothetical protein
MISPHCHSIEKVDHTFINWDKNEPDTRKKCLMANPAHCGRSPVSLRIADLPLLQASNQFFARKFGHVGIDQHFLGINHITQYLAIGQNLFNNRF